MSNLYAPFRYDYVGSFLRPAELKKARADYEAGAITADQLKAVEDQCITELVAKQKAAGYHVITDGEFRRATWHLDFMWGFDGVGHKKTNTLRYFQFSTSTFFIIQEAPYYLYPPFLMPRDLTVFLFLESYQNHNPAAAAIRTVPAR